MTAPVWPIEEYLARTQWPPHVAASIAAQNPNGKVEGELPAGVMQADHNRAVAAWRKMRVVSKFDYEAYKFRVDMSWVWQSFDRRDADIRARTTP